MNFRDAQKHWKDLRALRLWHWRQAMKARQMQGNEAYAIMYDPETRVTINDMLEKEVGKHIGFVQTLNVYFEPGDTAENDAAKANAT